MLTNKNKLKQFILRNETSSFQLNANKLLVGSAPFCDIKINSSTVSYLHAIIYIDDIITIQDLRSLNGTHINGVKVETFELTSECMLSFGSAEFHFITDDNALEIINNDSNIEKLQSNFDFNFITEITDNFKFEQNLKLATSLDFLKLDNLDCENYINLQGETFDDPRLTNANNELCLQMVTLSNLQIIEIEHVLFLNNSISINSDKNNIVSEFLPKNIKQFVKMDMGVATFECIENFNIHKIHENKFEKFENKHISIKLGEAVSYSNENLQFIFRIVETPPELRKQPFFFIDQAFQKEIGKVFATIMLPMLLLLLFKTEPPIEKKEIAIVYKRKNPIVSPHKDMMSEVTDKKVVGNQADQMVKPEQAKPQAAKEQVAENKAPKPAALAERKIASVKTFKLNAPTNMNSLFEKSNAPTKIVQDSGIATVDSLEIGKAGALNNNARNDIKISKIGNGTGATNYGVKGLSNRKGHQAAHIESETVVMGSMDPELLRKILQEYIPQFRHCYQQELTQNSDNAKGVIDLNFRINGNGSVTGIQVAGKKAQFSNNGTNCVASVLKLINFPKPKGGGIVDVKQPLNFFSDQQRI